MNNYFIIIRIKIYLLFICTHPSTLTVLYVAKLMFNVQREDRRRREDDLKTKQNKPHTPHAHTTTNTKKNKVLRILRTKSSSLVLCFCFYILGMCWSVLKNFSFTLITQHPEFLLHIVLGLHKTAKPMTPAQFTALWAEKRKLTIQQMVVSDTISHWFEHRKHDDDDEWR